MAATHPPDLSRVKRAQQSHGDPGQSRSDRDRAKREHQSERWFMGIFLIIMLFTVIYLIARSPVSSVLHV